MLGTNVGSIDMVKYAQSRGHHVTVVDHLPNNAGAKAFADDTASISTTDVDALVSYAKSHNVDAVLAGVSEVNIRSAIAISERLELPFYCTSEQWDALMDKSQFRKLALAAGLPSPETYYAGPGAEFRDLSTAAKLPVIVKPVDASSLRGITVCTTPADVSSAVKEATTASRTGNILIEQFVQGQEFTASYVVVDGEPSLSSIDDRYPLTLPGMTTSFPALRVYPSVHTQQFIDECDAAVRRLSTIVGLTNACVFFQGIRTDDGIVVFEAGLRMAGEAPYRFLQHVNGTNPLAHLVDSVLEQHSSYDVNQDDPYLGGSICAIASFVCGEGTIGEVRGVEEAATSLPSIIEVESRYRPGTYIRPDGTLRQIAVRFILTCENKSALIEDLLYLNAHIDVVDTDGNSMAHRPTLRIDAERLPEREGVPGVDEGQVKQ